MKQFMLFEYTFSTFIFLLPNISVVGYTSSIEESSLNCHTIRQAKLEETSNIYSNSQSHFSTDEIDIICKSDLTYNQRPCTIPSYNSTYQRYKQEIDSNNDSAQFKLSHYKGLYATQDYRIARHWYEKAAAQNDSDAQYNLGLMYHNGQGVTQDYGIARHWYEKAAAQNNSDAQYNLVLMYYNGQVVK